MLACGPPPQELPELTAAPNAPRCRTVSGVYRATFTLTGSEGTCGKAKQESHDPLEFDPRGRFVPPLGDLITCETLQVNCQLAVRCESESLNSRASLDAIVDATGDTFSGVSVVEGSYRGCVQVTYAVEATRLPPD